MKKPLIHAGDNRIRRYAGDEGSFVMATDLGHKIVLFCMEGSKDAWFWQWGMVYSLNPEDKVEMLDYFTDWQRPTLAEDTLFELETGYSLQKLFDITIPEWY